MNMKRFLRTLTAVLLLAVLFTCAADAPFARTAEAAAQSGAYIVTWDNRTIRAGKTFGWSDNGDTYTAPLTIYYSNADSMRVRLLGAKGLVVNGQDRSWNLSQSSGSVSWSCTIPKGSAPGSYKVRVDLTSGKRTRTFNFVWKVSKYVHTALPTDSMKRQFDYLKSMLPQGKFWNHGVKGVTTVRLNNGATTTISTSRCNAWSHKKDNFRDSAATCNYANHGYQCHGFAMLLATYVWGAEPTEKSRVSDPSAADTLEPGDVVRYLKDKHTIFVLKVEKDTVYFADCNWGQTCRIRWNGKVSAKNLKRTFSYVYKYSKR